MNSFWNDFINGINDGLIHVKREQIRQDAERLFQLAKLREEQILNSPISDFEKNRFLRILQNELSMGLNSLNNDVNKIDFIDCLNKISKSLK